MSRRTSTESGPWSTKSASSTSIASRTIRPRSAINPCSARSEPALSADRPGTNGRSRTAVVEDRKSSGRIRHDTKITVYVTEEELIGLEKTRLALREEHGLNADRGRIVREAIDVLLADFVDHGPDSVLVRRLKASE